MEVQCFTGGNFAQNGYVAWCEVTGQCVIVDPGAAALDKMAMGGPERERAISLGLKRAQELSWRRTAEATAAFLRRSGEA